MSSVYCFLCSPAAHWVYITIYKVVSMEDVLIQNNVQYTYLAMELQNVAICREKWVELDGNIRVLPWWDKFASLIFRGRTKTELVLKNIWGQFSRAHIQDGQQWFCSWNTHWRPIQMHIVNTGCLKENDTLTLSHNLPINYSNPKIIFKTTEANRKRFAA